MSVFLVISMSMSMKSKYQCLSSRIEAERAAVVVSSQTWTEYTLIPETPQAPEVTGQTAVQSSNVTVSHLEWRLGASRNKINYDFFNFDERKQKNYGNQVDTKLG